MHSTEGLDQHKDNNPVAIRFAETQAPFPEYCGAAKVASETLAELPKTAFADRENRALPLTTPGDTLLSGIYAMGLPASEYRDTMLGTLRKSAEAFGITEDWDRYHTFFTSVSKQAAAETPGVKYALTVTTNEVPRHYLPLRSPSEVQKAANVLIRQLTSGELPASFAVGAMRNIKEAALELGMTLKDLPARVVAGAANRVYDEKAATALLATRDHVCRDNPELSELYRDLVKAAGTAESDEDQQDRLALIEELDRSHGVKYASGIPLPHELVFSGVTERAFEKFADSQVVVFGTLVPATVVGSAPREGIQNYWAKESAEKLAGACDLAGAGNAAGASEALQALPDNTQREFLRFLLEA
jgi:hypothetical protein